MRWGIIKLIGLLTLISALFSWIQLLWPGLNGFLSGDRAFVRELLNPFSRFYDDTPLGGYLWFTVMAVSAIIVFLSLVLAGKAVVAYLDNSNASISVLKTKVTLSFLDVEMVDAVVDREQFVHANRPVTAYRMASSVMSPRATIDGSSLVLQSETIAAGPLKARILNTGTNKAREILEIFDCPLPSSRWCTYLPNWFVYRFRRYFPNSIVRRTSTIRQRHEYDSDDPIIQLTTLNHPTNNPTIELRFPEETAPMPKHIEGFLISQNAADAIVVREMLPRQPGLRIYYATVGSIEPDGTLRIGWSNKNLKRYKRQKRKQKSAKS